MLGKVEEDGVIKKQGKNSIKKKIKKVKPYGDKQLRVWRKKKGTKRD